MDYNKVFCEISKSLESYHDNGKVASYIPELKKVAPIKFGVHLCTVTGENYQFGDSEEKFSIQSICKVLSLTLAFEIEQEDLWKRVGVEPSGNPFNSLVQLEYDEGIPRNPFINAGAIVVADVLVSKLENPKRDFLDFVRKLSGNNTINYSERIAQSEKSKGHRNAALCNLMKSFGNIENNIHEVIEFYFDLCSIEMTCEELARTFLFLANYGKDPISGNQIVSSSKSKRINAVMQLCGLYDEAGEFSFKVGLPGKSGVGGGIAVVHPGKYSMVVWSPRLNKKGNSNKGMQFLEEFTSYTESSIF
ncbi:glutaminase [Marinifilum caeruleilacunae]|uniref:Glutaminase n=1 Tax=Marinifilum caeruleilacunae TaxID=2499076 RepID=A0ABX1WX80_9BACT|nr:glutaminase [Marinifilum caeruleilacunae]NOU60684.1 glutaminase [Marinifilum caeruleilacunae]